MKKQVYINASSLKYSMCPLSWKRTIIEGHYEGTSSCKIVYGQAVHKFIDTMYRTQDLVAAREAALLEFNVPKYDDRKSPHMSDDKHLLNTCFDIWHNYVMQPDEQFELLTLPSGKPAVEVTFSVPYYEDDIIEVSLCGTIDKIGKFKNGMFAIGDWKTTSNYDPARYLDSYRMSPQLRFYRLALTVMGRQHPDSMLGSIGNNPVGCFIDGVFLKPKSIDNKVIRSEVFQYKDMVQFEEALHGKIVELSGYIWKDNFPKTGIVNGACEQKFGKCAFYNACSVSDNKISDLILKRDFKQRFYDPLNRK